MINSSSKVDILKELYDGLIDLKKAHQIIDKIVSDFHDIKSSNQKFDGGGISEILGMNNYEYTAYCQGAELHEIAIWRYQGWPKICFETGKEFNYMDFGWIVKNVNGKSKLVLLN